MKRAHISLEAIAERSNLLLALHKAAHGKRHRPEVADFLGDMDANLNQLAVDILVGRLPYGEFRSFHINDPKPRLIHAACFPDRVFHHALMNHASPVLERAMLLTTYACRPNMGVHKAAQAVQRHLRQYPWYAKIDVDAYFASIDHGLLLNVLLQRFKGAELIPQFQRILASYQRKPGRGLPIGSLTSQYFANYYLDGLDRLLANSPLVCAHIRYMDDVVWWGRDKVSTDTMLQQVRHYLHHERGLSVKPNVQIQRSQQGITYCGFHITPGTIRLSRRRKRRYQERRQYWEQRYLHGDISADELQTAYAAVHAITQGTDSLAWRQENLRRHPPISL